MVYVERASSARSASIQRWAQTTWLMEPTAEQLTGGGKNKEEEEDEDDLGWGGGGDVPIGSADDAGEGKENEASFPIPLDHLPPPAPAVVATCNGRSMRFPSVLFRRYRVLNCRNVKSTALSQRLSNNVSGTGARTEEEEEEEGSPAALSSGGGGGGPFHSCPPPFPPAPPPPFRGDIPERLDGVATTRRSSIAAKDAEAPRGGVADRNRDAGAAAVV